MALKKFWKRMRKGRASTESQPDPKDAIASKVALAVEDLSADIATGSITSTKVTKNDTTIHEAARQGRDALVVSLLRKNANVNSKSTDLRTPLSLAAEWGRTSTIEILLIFCARVHEPDGDGRRPLHWAAEYGHADVVRVLMEHGALADVRSKSGDTPSSLAWACDQHEVLRMMRTVNSKKQVARTGPLATHTGTIVMPHVTPSERVQWSATTTLGTRRMTELEERWLDQRSHDPFA